MLTVLLFVKPPLLFKLGGAAKGAQLHGYTNGLSKALIWRMVDLVIDNWLCPKHQSSINM